MAKVIPRRKLCAGRVGSEGAQAVVKSRNVVEALRRDVSFVWHAVIAIVFVGFAGLAMFAALIDLMSLRQ